MIRYCAFYARRRCKIKTAIAIILSRHRGRSSVDIFLRRVVVVGGGRASHLLSIFIIYASGARRVGKFKKLSSGRRFNQSQQLFMVSGALSYRILRNVDNNNNNDNGTMSIVIRAESRCDREIRTVSSFNRSSVVKYM